MTHKHIQTKANTDKLCETMLNQRYSPIKKKQRNLGVRFEPLLLLEFLSTAGKLLWYLRGSSCLIVTLLFSALFLQYFPLFYLPILSIYSRSANSRLCTQIECFLLSIIKRHAPLLLIGYKCVLGLGPTLWSKAFFKNWNFFSTPLRVCKSIFMFFKCFHIYMMKNNLYE